MYWQEETDEQQFSVPDEIVDLRFKIDCKALPVDHAWELSQAVIDQLPWFADDPVAGLHLLYGADSGNGWERPAGPDDLIYLSRRTRLVLRLPRERLQDAASLEGQTLDIKGHALTIGQSHEHLLAITQTLYSRYVYLPSGMTEDGFMEAASSQIKSLGIRYKKMLCGKSAAFTTPQGKIDSMSLMVAGLGVEDAVKLQQQGIGDHQKLGLGLFVPHKSV